MADGLVQVGPDSTGKKVDTSELTVGANTVERQRIVMADPTTAAALATVRNSEPVDTDYALVVRSILQQKVTYTAVYRLAARPYAISKVFTAGSRFQFATIHHAATAVKMAKIKRCEIALESSSVAGIIVADLKRITTAPATGNPAITPSPADPGDAAAETTCLSLPTTAATEGALHSMLEWNLGITTTGSVINPPPPLQWLTLWPQTQGASEASTDKFPTIRAGILEGFAVTLDVSSASTVKGFVVIEFTEE